MDGEHAFPTYKRTPIVAATWIGDATADYAEALVVADVAYRYAIVATQNGKVFDMSFQTDGDAPEIPEEPPEETNGHAVKPEPMDTEPAEEVKEQTPEVTNGNDDVKPMES